MSRTAPRTALPSARLAPPSIATVSRRGFLAGSGAVVAATALGTRVALASPELPAVGDVIVTVFLRGGMDGLSLVAPYRMASYRTLRPTIRVKAPDELAGGVGAGLPLDAGGNVGAFTLSGTFGLHPGMRALYDTAWADGHLAVVHAVGMPAAESATRSHFDSMRNWEAGTASTSVSTGYLNRFLAAVNADRIAGLGLGSALQRSLAGPMPAYSMGGVDGFGVSGFANDAVATEVLRRWYHADPADVVGRTGAGTLTAVNSVRSVNWADPRFDPQHGATYPDTEFGAAMAEVAALIRAGIGLRAACVDVGGWDTHSDVGAPEDPGSYFRYRATELAQGLAAFYVDLGSGMDEVTVTTLSEFGRTIDENGTGGCDHGRATAMLVMGNGIRGGVHGPFVPEIVNGPEDDLAVLTDYRTVLAEVLTRRGGASSAASIFPTWPSTAALGVCR